MLKLSPEYRILAYAATNRPDSAGWVELASLLKRHPAPERLITVAEKEGMAGLLYHTLKHSGLVRHLSATHAKRLESVYHRTTGHNLRLISDLKSILIRLNRKKIPVVVLKGMALVHTVYRNSGLRPMGDIDLWVGETDFTALKKTLLGLGYRNVPLYPKTFRKEGTVIDVHTHLLWADRIKARKWLLAKPQTHMLRRTRFIDIEGQRTRCLDPFDQVLYLSLHALKHNVRQLIGLADIKLIVEKWSAAEWDRLLARSKAMGQIRSVGGICFLLRKLMAMEPHPEIRRLMREIGPGVLERRVLKKRIEMGELPAWANLVLLRPRNNPAHQFLYILETLIPGRNILRQVFGDTGNRKGWILYMMRIRQLWGMARSGR